MMWAAGAVAAMSSITFPAISAIVSRNADPDQQGRLQIHLPCFIYLVMTGLLLFILVSLVSSWTFSSPHQCVYLYVCRCCPGNDHRNPRPL